MARRSAEKGACRTIERHTPGSSEAMSNDDQVVHAVDSRMTIIARREESTLDPILRIMKTHVIVKLLLLCLNPRWVRSLGSSLHDEKSAGPLSRKLFFRTLSPRFIISTEFGRFRFLSFFLYYLFGMQNNDVDAALVSMSINIYELNYIVNKVENFSRQYRRVIRNAQRGSESTNPLSSPR